MKGMADGRVNLEIAHALLAFDGRRRRGRRDRAAVEQHDERGGDEQAPATRRRQHERRERCDEQAERRVRRRTVPRLCVPNDNAVDDALERLADRAPERQAASIEAVQRRQQAVAGGDDRVVAVGVRVVVAIDRHNRRKRHSEQRRAQVVRHQRAIVIVRHGARHVRAKLQIHIAVVVGQRRQRSLSQRTVGH